MLTFIAPSALWPAGEDYDVSRHGETGRQETRRLTPSRRGQNAAINP
jgi:hypothetical protein